MSHWWGNNFLHLVRAICEHAAGKTELFPHMYTDDDKRKTFWLCIFGVNQHVSICGTEWNPCDCGTPKLKMGNPLCQMDKFPFVMKRIKKHGLAMDLELKLTRVWVLAELDAAMQADPVMSSKFCGVVSDTMLHDPCIPSVTDAESRFPDDKELIIGAIKRRMDGIKRFDESIRSNVSFEIARIRLFVLVAQGDSKCDQIGCELDKWPALLNVTNSRGRGETPLMISSRYGHPKLVQLFLERGCEVQKMTGMMWPALHYAAICFNPESTEAIVRMLLVKRADPNLLNSFGRTPLQDCMLSLGLVDTARMLIEVTDDGILKFEEMISQATGGGQRQMSMPETVSFTPLPSDAVFFSHGYLRQDSWQRPDLNIAIRQPINRDIQIHSAWVKPTEFGTGPGELVRSQQGRKLFYAARRLCSYIQYRWPLWDFDSVLLKYTTPQSPCHYRVDIKRGTVAQVDDEDVSRLSVDEQRLRKHDVLTRVPASVRFLYP